MLFSFACGLALSGSETVAGSGSLSGQILRGLLGDWRALLWLAALPVVFVLAAWAASLLLVPRLQLNSFAQYDRRPGGSFGKALSLGFLYALLAAAVVVGLRFATLAFKVALLTALSTPSQLEPRWVAIFAGLALLALILLPLLPMSLFRIHLGRALALLLLALLVSAGAGWALDARLGRPVEQRRAAFQEWADQRRIPGHGLLDSLAVKGRESLGFAATEKMASDQARPLAERKEAVRQLYALLESSRTALKEGDIAGRAEYDRQKARYDELLKALREEIARTGG